MWSYFFPPKSGTYVCLLKGEFEYKVVLATFDATPGKGWNRPVQYWLERTFK